LLSFWSCSWNWNTSANTLDTVSEARLAHYNHILQEQLTELDQEIAHVERQFRRAYGLASQARLTPKR
jgi:hypothetical protein